MTGKVMPGFEIGVFIGNISLRGSHRRCRRTRIDSQNSCKNEASQLRVARVHKRHKTLGHDCGHVHSVSSAKVYLEFAVKLLKFRTLGIESSMIKWVSFTSHDLTYPFHNRVVSVQQDEVLNVPK